MIPRHFPITYITFFFILASSRPEIYIWRLQQSWAAPQRYSGVSAGLRSEKRSRSYRLSSYMSASFLNDIIISCLVAPVQKILQSISFCHFPDSFFQKIKVTQSAALGHRFTSPSRHSTGARLPSVSLRISPRGYSFGFLASRYPP